MREIKIWISCGEFTCDGCDSQDWSFLEDGQPRCELFGYLLLLSGEDNCYRCDSCMEAEEPNRNTA